MNEMLCTNCGAPFIEVDRNDSFGNYSIIYNCKNFIINFSAGPCCHHIRYSINNICNGYYLKFGNEYIRGNRLDNKTIFIKNVEHCLTIDFIPLPFGKGMNAAALDIIERFRRLEFYS